LEGLQQRLNEYQTRLEKDYLEADRRLEEEEKRIQEERNRLRKLHEERQTLCQKESSRIQESVSTFAQLSANSDQKIAEWTDEHTKKELLEWKNELRARAFQSQESPLTLTLPDALPTPLISLPNGAR